MKKETIATQVLLTGSNDGIGFILRFHSNEKTNTIE